MNLIKHCRHGVMIYNQKDIWQGRSFEVYGEYSEAEVDLFRAAIKLNDVVIDAGANIGSLTLPIARLVGSAGYVLAYEPERHAFYTLAGNIAINNLRNVICVHQALGDAQKVINVPELDFARTVNFGGLELDKDYDTAAHYPVYCNTIDSLELEQCNFMKVDVEGMELQVLQGAEKTIKKHAPLLYVEYDRLEKRYDLLKFIKSLGYKCLLHTPPFWNPDNFYGQKNNVFADVASFNLFCWQNECPVNPAVLKLQKVDDELLK